MRTGDEQRSSSARTFAQPGGVRKSTRVAWLNRSRHDYRLPGLRSCHFNANRDRAAKNAGAWTHMEAGQKWEERSHGMMHCVQSGATIREPRFQSRSRNVQKHRLVKVATCLSKRRWTRGAVNKWCRALFTGEICLMTAGWQFHVTLRSGEAPLSIARHEYLHGTNLSQRLLFLEGNGFLWRNSDSSAF